MAAGARGVTTLTSEFMQGCHAGLGDRGAWPSTGHLALCVGLAVAGRLGARLSAYGFGACPPCNRYFDCDGSNATDTGARGPESQGTDAYHPFGPAARG